MNVILIRHDIMRPGEDISGEREREREGGREMEGGREREMERG